MRLTQQRLICFSLPFALACGALPRTATAATPSTTVEAAKWGPWRPASDRKRANFDAGFSNLELGGYMEFEQACKRDTGLPEKQIEYRFRLSRLIDQIGTGTVETGCWFKGKILHRYSSPAIRPIDASVDCLRVISPQGGGLNVRSDAGVNNSLVGVVGNGRSVKPTYHPASIIERGGRYWVAIAAPIAGWVSNGRPGGVGNMRICSK
ncbi:SH3 domain-containing protein [filamentous cyanobacterium LEGE 11480]|uniref:SH3 domain-containing protein n=1 Tax=Romeriopsis navalis LEGE 11480 TaxID=2777977 RepID=A0A928VP37_9CYAN|nr:SH3 domain-containing protein [Romeriopsis navalis]MBE9031875.1 SH3 domain-containing protein [Romeriopsis navalis LEGE 11480]